MYELIFDEEAIDFLQKSEKKIRERIFNKLTSTKKDPFHYFERLTGRQDYKLRVGDYRVISEIDKSTQKIKVTLIGHRKNVYKNI